MRYIIILLFLCTSASLQAQNASIVKWGELKQLLEKNDDSVRVFNFWATWCAPCVKELPEFSKARDRMQDSAVIYYFISLDFKRDYEKRLIPFLLKNPLPGQVFLLDEPDYNRWIDQIDPAWEGSIPATLTLGQGARKKHFHEGELNADQIIQHIKQTQTK